MKIFRNGFCYSILLSLIVSQFGFSQVGFSQEHPDSNQASIFRHIKHANLKRQIWDFDVHQENPFLIDLHAHLFMNEALTWLYSGDFFDKEISAKDWSDRFSSQINADTLNKSGLRIVVAALYAISPFFTPNLKESIRQQIKMANQFVIDNPEWVIAKDPRQARSEYQNGKRLLVLSIEGIAKIMDTQETIDEFYDLGVRIVTFSHLSNDHLGGAALLGGLSNITNLGAWICGEDKSCDGKIVRVNQQGLTNEGRELAQKLIDKKIWIDLSHASDQTQKDLIPLLKEAHQPLLYTHTSLRKYLGAERGVTMEQLGLVKETHGLVGLMPSPRMLSGTPASCKHKGCIETFLRQYTDIAEKVGSVATVFGSDFNGTIDHLTPHHFYKATLSKNGYFNIGQTWELWNEMEKYIPGVLPKPGVSVEYFLSSWDLLYQ